jgi:hypothetical protein
LLALHHLKQVGLYRQPELNSNSKAPQDPSETVLLAPGLDQQGPNLAIRRGYAGAVAEFFVDGEGLAVPVQGLVVVAPCLGDHAELV